MKIRIYTIQFLAVVCCCYLFSCEDFVDVDVPAHTISSKTVFEKEETAIAAMQGIYNELQRSAYFSNGGDNSVTALAGLAGDEIWTLDGSRTAYLEFENHEILPGNPHNLNLWNGAYNIIYLVNSLLEGLEGSSSLSSEVKDRLQGEAKFIRAFTYFYLVNLYGAVPLVLSTDYSDNAEVTRTGVNEVYDQIVMDLDDSYATLGSDYSQGERTQVNRNVAAALLARVHLYRENWDGAEAFSSQVISQSGTYELLDSLDDVFLANSREAIWQISPIGSGENSATNTRDAYLFISAIPVFGLEEVVTLNFSEADNRELSWIGYAEDREAYYPNKYKNGSATGPISEYSMVLRFSEQFLIRAEARARLGDLSGAIQDIDRVRARAGAVLISESNPTISQAALLELIFQERRNELFTEWGHRWFDAIRTGRATEIFGTDGSDWEATDMLFPIPEEERAKNPRLEQNPGY